MNKAIYIEQNCCLELEGQSFCAGGAVVTDDYIIAYIGKPIGDGMGCDRFGSTSRRELNDWHGDIIGTCYISSTWPTPNSYISSYMHQVYATVNDVTYTGRSAGQGMIFKGKRCAKQ